MIADLKPYTEYKESGLPWLGQVPGHWDLLAIRRVFRAVTRRDIRGDEVKMSMSRHLGLVPSAMLGARSSVKSESIVYSVCHVGDLVMNKYQAHAGLFGCAIHRGLITSNYTVFRPSPDASAAFFAKIFASKPYQTAFEVESYGVGDGMSPLYTGVFYRIFTVLPPPTEQAAIVRFLDWANGRLEGAIRAKRKVIALLNEQKQAIIHRAVTRGLDPSVPLKPSGIPWLCDIPQHWEAWRISRCARVGNGSTPSRGKPAYWNNGTYPWLNSSQVNRGFIASADQFVTPTALRECHLPRVPAGSVLVAITGQGKTRGTAALLGFEATINQHIAFITPRINAVFSEFLQLAFVAAYQTLRALSEDSGSTKGALTCENLKRFKVALPPLREQTVLVAHIRAETQTLNTAISRLEREIELLREYRTRLVADVVTGKLDVREAAARLPDEGAPGTVEDDIDPSLDPEAADEEAAV